MLISLPAGWQLFTSGQIIDSTPKMVPAHAAQPLYIMPWSDQAAAANPLPIPVWNFDANGGH